MGLNPELWSQVDVPLERALDGRRLCLSGPRDGAPLMLCGGVAGAGVAASDGPGAKAEAYEARRGYRGDLLAGALSSARSQQSVVPVMRLFVSLSCVRTSQSADDPFWLLASSLQFGL